MRGQLPAKEPLGYRAVAQVATAWSCICCGGHEAKEAVQRRVRRVARRQMQKETEEVGNGE